MKTETKAKHTPGPWYLVEKEIFGYSVRANTETGSEIIAETGGFNDGRNMIALNFPSKGTIWLESNKVNLWITK